MLLQLTLHRRALLRRPRRHSAAEGVRCPGRSGRGFTTEARRKKITEICHISRVVPSRLIWQTALGLENTGAVLSLLRELQKERALPELKPGGDRIQIRQSPLPVFSVPPCLQRSGWFNLGPERVVQGQWGQRRRVIP